MKKTLLMIGLFLSVIVQAQEYTYVMDKTFNTSTDLLGYTFIPSTIIYPNEYDPRNPDEVTVGVGDYSFSITQNYLYIEGSEIEGVYSANSINPTEYGYIIATMNARNPMIQGHLKIVLDNNNRANGLIFKKSNDTKEMIFKITETPEYLERQEAAFFTNMNNPALTIDNIWGNTFYPFFRIGESQQRLRMQDSVQISFHSDTTVVEKKKREKVEIDQYILFSYRGVNKNGIRTKYEQRYNFKSIKERESRDPNAVADKFLLEIEVSGLPEKYIYFYLNHKRAVSKFELGPNQFIIRGY